MRRTYQIISGDRVVENEQDDEDSEDRGCDVVSDHARKLLGGSQPAGQPSGQTVRRRRGRARLRGGPVVFPSRTHRVMIATCCRSLPEDADSARTAQHDGCLTYLPTYVPSRRRTGELRA